LLPASSGENFSQQQVMKIADCEDLCRFLNRYLDVEEELQIAEHISALLVIQPQRVCILRFYPQQATS
jgi:hypothetical protein